MQLRLIGLETNKKNKQTNKWINYYTIFTNVI